MLLVDRRGVDGARALTGAAGALLLLTACGGSTGPVGGATPGASSSETAASPAPVPPLTTYELVKGVTVDVPASWRSADYLATPATVYFPLRFFSTSEFGVRCTANPDVQSCMDGTWFAPGWSTPRNGVLLLWSATQFPGNGGPVLQDAKGEQTTIDGHKAKIWSGRASAGCARGAATELDAAVITHTDEYPGERMELVACFGPDATPEVRADVDDMVRSLRFEP